MRPPYFPVRVTDLLGDITFHDAARTSISRRGRRRCGCATCPTSGPPTAIASRSAAASIAYISDHQQPLDGCDTVADSVLELCDGADLLIHDAQYTPEEFRMKSNWGHCTVDYAVRVAAEAGARRLALFHHDPAHADADVDRILLGCRDSRRRLGFGEVIAAAEARPCRSPSAPVAVGVAAVSNDPAGAA